MKNGHRLRYVLIIGWGRDERRIEAEAEWTLAGMMREADYVVGSLRLAVGEAAGNPPADVRAITIMREWIPEDRLPDESGIRENWR